MQIYTFYLKPPNILATIHRIRAIIYHFAICTMQKCYYFTNSTIVFTPFIFSPRSSESNLPTLGRLTAA